MTWGFGYLACFIVGLVLASVSGLIRDLQCLARPNVVVPHASRHLPFLTRVGRLLAAGLILSGLVGLFFAVRRNTGSRAALLWAIVAGVVGVLAALLPLGRHRSSLPGHERATVVKDIQPGGYGQVRLERDGVAVLLAAQSAEPLVIPAGADVEVVECAHSVITVRLPSRR